MQSSPFSEAPLRSALALVLLSPLVLGALIWLLIIAAMLAANETLKMPLNWWHMRQRRKRISSLLRKSREATRSAKNF